MDAPVKTVVNAVSDTASDVLILAANGARQGASITNDSAAILYLLLGTGTASSTNFTVELYAGDYYELPLNRHGCYTGEIRGIWDSDSTGSARVTEFV